MCNDERLVWTGAARINHDGDALCVTQPLQVRGGLGHGRTSHEAGHLAPPSGPCQLADDLPDSRLRTSLEHTEDLLGAALVVFQKHAHAMRQTRESVLVCG